MQNSGGDFRTPRDGRSRRLLIVFAACVLFWVLVGYLVLRLLK